MSEGEPDPSSSGGGRRRRGYRHRNRCGSAPVYVDGRGSGRERADRLGRGRRRCLIRRAGSQQQGGRFTGPVLAVIDERGHRVEPEVCFQVGAAACFSECAVMIVASRSTGIRPPPAPGARSPTATRLAPVPASGLGGSPATFSDWHQRGSWLAATPSDQKRSARTSPGRSTTPPDRPDGPAHASLTARSATIFPDHGPSAVPATRPGQLKAPGQDPSLRVSPSAVAHPRDSLASEGTTILACS